MKRDVNIASMFQKFAAKKVSSSSLISRSSEDNTNVAEEETAPPSPPPSPPPALPPSPPPPPPVFDPDRLPQDPAERLPIVSYPINDQDAVRRAYIMKGPFQPYAHEFKKRKIGTRDRWFNLLWF
jgi:hypothetical protein